MILYKGRKYTIHEHEKFSRLTVVDISHKDKRGVVLLLCICDCGKIVRQYVHNLVTGKALSCGCYNIEAARLRSTKHGCVNSGLYNIWKAMLYRCNNEKAINYKHYGGRGISVCKRWHDVRNFVEDMKHGYMEGLTIERIDANGDYCIENCTWVTRAEQNRNKRNSRYVVVEGKKLTITDAAKNYGVNITTLWRKLNKGLSIEEILGINTLT